MGLLMRLLKVIFVFTLLQLCPIVSAQGSSLSQQSFDDTQNDKMEISKIYVQTQSQEELPREEDTVGSIHKRRNLQALNLPVKITSAAHCNEWSPYRMSMVLDQTLASCNTLCNNNVECFEFEFSASYSRCDLYRSISCTYYSQTFDIYRPSKSSNCPIPFPARTLIKSNWSCWDQGAVRIGNDVFGKSLDECENICIGEPLCVFFMHRPSDGSCGIRKEGCAATARTYDVNAYHPTGYVPPECNCIFSSVSPSSVIAILSYTNSAQAQTLVNLANELTSSDPTCTVPQIVIKEKGCIQPYSGFFLSKNEYVVKGQSNILNGWEETVCIEWSTSKQIFHQKDNMVFRQTPVDCNPSLVAISQSSPIQIPYVNGGTGITQLYTFFTFTPILGCTLSCSPGNTCEQNDLSGLEIVVTQPSQPWTITTSNSVVLGYEKSVCVQCESNNAESSSPFTNQITIKQTCELLKNQGEYQTIFEIETAQVGTIKYEIQLPFLNVEKSQCQVDKIELFDVVDVNRVIIFPQSEIQGTQCPGLKCQNFVQIDHSKVASASFQFKARVTLTSQISFETTLISGITKCGTSSPQLTPPEQQLVTLIKGDNSPFQFQPFLISNPNFPICGFDQYTISIVKKDEEQTLPIYQYPPTGVEFENCNFLTSCNLININTDDVTKLTVTIRAITFEPKTVQTIFDLQIVECNSDSSVVTISQATKYYQVVLYDAQSVTQAFFIPEFSSSNSFCPISSIELVDGSEGLQFLQPCDPRNGCDQKVKYLKNTKTTYEFKLKAKALNGLLGKSVLLTFPIQIEVCDSKDMTNVDQGLISKVYGLNSQSGVERVIQKIQALEHQQLLYMNSCQSCPLTNFKFIDDQNVEIQDFHVDNFQNIVVSTTKPFKKSFNLVGIMPKSLMNGQCNTIIEERMIPIKVEVCGLENVGLRSVQELKYEFVIGQDPKEVGMSGKEIKALFNGGSMNCPISFFQIVKNEQGELFQSTDPVWKYLKFDLDYKLTFTNSKIKAQKGELYIQASTIGKVQAFKKVQVTFYNEAPTFSAILDPTIISIKELEQTKMKETFSYISPLAVDQEKNNIQFRFFSEFQCKCVEFFVINDKQFEMRIDKSKITIEDKGEQTVLIILQDEYYADSMNQTVTKMIVKIEYDQKPKEIVVEEQDLQDHGSTNNHKIAEGTKTEVENLGEGQGESQIVKEEVEVAPEKHKESATESALVQQKGDPKVEIQGPAVAEWQTQVDSEEMKTLIAKSIYLAKLRSDEAKKVYEMKQEQSKKEKGIYIPPKLVEASIQSVTSDGKLLIYFNQPVAIPEFVKNAKKLHSEKSKKRQLEEGEFDSLNVNEIFDITLALKSDEDPEKANFYLSIDKWDEQFIELKMNFTEPLSISKGRNYDAIIVKLKNPDMFISKETGVSMENRLGANTLAEKIPKQVPQGVDAAVVKQRAKASALFIKTMLIIQIILSIFLKGAMNDLWGLYFTLQIMCYITVYDNYFPQSVEEYIQEFKKIIEFEILSPEGAIRLFYPDFNLTAFISGYKVAVNKDQESSVLKDMQVYIMVLVVVSIGIFIVLVARVVFKKYSSKIKGKLIQAKNKFFWNGAVRSFYISFAQILFTTTIQFKMIIRESRYVDLSSYLVCIGTSFYCLLTIMLITITLFILRNKLGDRDVRNTYENMYLGVNYIRKGGLKLYFWPIFLLRKVVFFTIPVVLLGMGTLQIQILCFFTSLYIILIVTIEPHLDKTDSYKEMFNEVATMISCYHLFCFTDFNLDDEQKYLMGHSYICCVGVTFVFNVFLMVRKNIHRYQRKVRMVAQQTHFRFNQEKILRSEHVERLLESKKNLNANLDLKSEYKKQEERRMIKKMERLYLKVEGEEFHRMAQMASRKRDKQKVEKMKTKSLRKEKKLEIIREETNETISDEESLFSPSTRLSQKLIKKASKKRLDQEIRESKEFEAIFSISPQDPENPKKIKKQEVPEPTQKENLLRTVTKPSKVQFKLKSRPASLLQNMKIKMQLEK